jgi:hypothetical protein
MVRYAKRLRYLRAAHAARCTARHGVGAIPSPLTGANTGCSGHVYGRTAGTGMMANPTATPRATITAAMMIATAMFPF